MTDTAGSATAARRVRHRRGEGGRLREDIVWAATAIIDEAGTAAAVTLRAVARRVGITAPAIYAHFPDPSAILLAVVEDEFARLRVRLRDAVEQAGADPESRLRAMCSGYLEYARAQPQRYLLLFGGVWQADHAREDSTLAWSDVVDLGQAVLGDLTACLQACVDHGLSGSQDVATDATALWVGLHGLAHQRILSTALPWPPLLEQRLIARLAYL